MIRYPLSVVFLVLFSVFTQLLFSCQPEKHQLLIGTYTSGESEGIYLCSFDERNEELLFEGLMAKAENPSYLTVSEHGERIFAVNEIREGLVTTFQWDGTQLKQTGTSPVEGDHPCYVDISPDQRYIAVANYTSGNFSVIRPNENGSMEAPVSWQHTGRGVDSMRQKGPHAHCAKWLDENSLLIADLGIDQIIPYRIEQETRIVKVNDGIKMNAGCGPRHIVFHPFGDLVYATCELSNEVAVMELDPEGLKLTTVQYISTLPEDFIGVNTNADLHITPDGKYLYVSNRGHNSIAAFRIMDSGKLEPLGHFSTRGEKPRNFIILPGGKHLLVANQDSNNIVAFRIMKDGSLEFTGSEIAVSSPVCLKSL